MVGILRFPGGEGGSNELRLMLGGGVRGSGKEYGCGSWYCCPPRGVGEEKLVLVVMPATGEVVRFDSSSMVSSGDNDCCC